MNEEVQCPECCGLFRPCSLCRDTGRIILTAPEIGQPQPGDEYRATYSDTVSRVLAAEEGVVVWEVVSPTRGSFGVRSCDLREFQRRAGLSLANGHATKTGTVNPKT